MTPVVLTRPHTHAGKTYPPGERFTVDAATAQWLLTQGIAHPDTPPEPKPAKPDPDPKPLPVKEPKA